PPAEAEDITLPDGTRVQAALAPGPALFFARDRAKWWYEVNGTALMVQLADGKGDVTVMSSFAPFYNRALGRHQHAELLWRLTTQGGGGGPVWLVRRLQTQTLPSWLVENALPALIALGILITLLLWHVVPRFGPLVTVSPQDRRSL